jgi:hypothetical protein
MQSTPRESGRKTWGDLWDSKLNQFLRHYAGQLNTTLREASRLSFKNTIDRYDEESNCV